MSENTPPRSVQQAIEESRKRFVSVSQERIEKARNILQELQRVGPDPVKVDNLKRFFHQLAGAAGLYDMPEFCECAITSEDLSMQLRGQSGDAFNSTTGQLLSLCSKLETLLLAGAEGTPADDSPEAQLARQRVSGGYASPFMKTVLIVSGSPRPAAAINEVLESLGIRSEVCSNLASARDFIESDKPSGLVVCGSAAKGGELELVRLVRSKSGGEEIPVVFYGRSDTFMDKMIAIKAGCDAFWESGISQEQLEDKIRRVFNRLASPKYRIMLVEDDPIQATNMYSFLEAAGFEPLVMTDASQFEEGLLSAQPDLIILDVDLGELTGFELARYVRQNEKFNTLPIIFLTTKNQLKDHIQGARLGDDYLIKPAQPQLLVATIAGRLERYKAMADMLGRDALTGTLSYAEFMKNAERMRARGQNSPSIIIVDIDGLAEINEEHGYAVGEKVISILADLLKQTIRNFGVIGRLSGDEFGIAIESLSDNELLELAGFLKNEFQQVEFQAPGGQFSASITCGISRLREGMGLNDWLKAAYDAYSVARSHGKDTVAID